MNLFEMTVNHAMHHIFGDCVKDLLVNFFRLLAIIGTI